MHLILDRIRVQIVVPEVMAMIAASDILFQKIIILLLILNSN